MSSLIATLLLVAACGKPPSTPSLPAESRAEQDHQTALSRVRGNIESVLKTDAQTQQLADASRRATAMRGIDISHCPGDFQAAYLNHIFAWEYAARVEHAIESFNSDDAVAGARATSAASTILNLEATPITDHLHEAQRLEELSGQADREIRSTLQRVQLVATQYGATLPG